MRQIIREISSVLTLVVLATLGTGSIPASARVLSHGEVILGQPQIKLGDGKVMHFDFVNVSRKFDSWESTDIVVEVPRGTHANILQFKQLDDGAPVPLKRYKVSIRYRGKRYTGWVHTYETSRPR